MISGWYGNYTWEKEYYEADGKGANGYKTIDGKNYYFEDGRMLLSETFLADSYLYIISGSGEVVQRVSASKNGWIAAGDEWYYAQNGELVKGEWITYKGNQYFLKWEGKMASSEWLYQTYYFKSWGGRYQNEWAKINGKWYCFGEDGQKYVSRWLEYKGNLYYFRKDGTRQEDGWFKQGSTWYWMENGGKMAVGWRKINNVWYYFKSSGAMCQNEWLKQKGIWYYFKDGGAMCQDESYSVKGISYEFDQNGHLKE